jgi:hypothetical protein
VRANQMEKKEMREFAEERDKKKLSLETKLIKL